MLDLPLHMPQQLPMHSAYVMARRQWRRTRRAKALVRQCPRGPSIHRRQAPAGAARHVANLGRHMAPATSCLRRARADGHPNGTLQ
jgi:hypothetical protein